ncbi:unnamed protein product (macronuclear) [Paramecium tetraurelia]|uniref:Uncharacterized protein n=1 Tax=Paramecium tetraurelia TaxID=5888 RepID=A0C4G1_PARTE|nr:uncharacterized protein GSPATT00035158001 [Paramecium tetraurelia]CAK65678.1 unnamed protein product [Paramecium tetraurelia]|eukprot:XP_001433075.1 hypothetical protein (macronuclear) [Paramecium tetraurelia strain d4-2]
MKSNQEFEEEVENLIREAVSKNNTIMRDDLETTGKSPKKQFFQNRNKIDINEAWREIEKLFENFSIQEKKSIENPILREEQKVIEQIEILETPQPKMHSLQIETTRTKEPNEEMEKERINCIVTRRFKFNLD